MGAGRNLDDVRTRAFSNWCKANRLVLNRDKTQHMLFSRGRDLARNFTVDNTSLNDCVRYLETYIDTELSWTTHVDAVCKRLGSAFFGLHKLKSILNRQELLGIYYAMAYSHFSYNIVVWGQAHECVAFLFSKCES